ncbi:MAG TPA: helix-turn-helix domain-containing protein [Micromonosporaceae bacterium]|nr:helix-turn-helix domain-containing protein [Micromonosporaceae bacterium]
MAEQQRLEIRDPQVMRALAHPARLAIMEHLMTGDTGTATECAQVCGLSPSATSYHLRALAKVGLVEEAASRGDGRERVWQSRVRGFDLSAESGGDVEAGAAERDLVTVVVERQDAQTRAWLATLADEPPPWREAAALTEGTLLLDAAELTALSGQIVELIRPYAKARRRAGAPPGSRQVRVIFRAFPTD